MQIARGMGAEALSSYFRKGSLWRGLLSYPYPRQLGSIPYAAHDKGDAKTGPVRTEGFGPQPHSGRTQARFSPVNLRLLATAG